MERYILITFPDVQEFMEEDWFNEEAYLCQALDNQEHYDSAYFIPENRLTDES